MIATANTPSLKASIRPVSLVSSTEACVCESMDDHPRRATLLDLDHFRAAFRDLKVRIGGSRKWGAR